MMVVGQVRREVETNLHGVDVDVRLSRDQHVTTSGARLQCSCCLCTRHPARIGNPAAFSSSVAAGEPPGKCYIFVSISHLSESECQRGLRGHNSSQTNLQTRNLFFLKNNSRSSTRASPPRCWSHRHKHIITNSDRFKGKSVWKLPIQLRTSYYSLVLTLERRNGLALGLVERSVDHATVIKLDLVAGALMLP